WVGSVTAILNAMRHAGAGLVHDWFVLAMDQWRLNEKSRATQLLSYAESRFSAGVDRSRDLLALRDEARSWSGVASFGASPGDQRVHDDASAFTLLLEIAPGLPWIYQHRGVACIQMKQWDQAAADFSRVTEAEPQNYHCWYAQAVCRLTVGDLAGYRKA